MQITKITNNMILDVTEDVHVHFDSFKNDGETGVILYLSGNMVAYLYFDQATEFYKAWRAM
jgi:hypothetical protein